MQNYNITLNNQLESITLARDSNMKYYETTGNSKQDS
jgi:hypothetical protein